MTTNPETTIEADPQVPTIRITRDFAAPPEHVFRAFTDPELFARWVGPDAVTTTIDRWDAQTGGGYRYLCLGDGGEYGFFGSFHEVRPNERIVQTFTWEGMPDGVSLETMTITDLGGGRTRIDQLSVVDSMAARDAIMSSGMDTGVEQGFVKLDALLAELAGTS